VRRKLKNRLLGSTSEKGTNKGFHADVYFIAWAQSRTGYWRAHDDSADRPIRSGAPARKADREMLKDYLPAGDPRWEACYNVMIEPHQFQAEDTPPMGAANLPSMRQLPAPRKTTTSALPRMT
jgi:hypothetical protein